MSGLTDKDRAEAAKLFEDAEATISRVPAAGVVLRPLMQLIRWIMAEMDRE